MGTGVPLGTLWVNSKIVVYSVHTGLCKYLMNANVYVVLESKCT